MSTRYPRSVSFARSNYSPASRSRALRPACLEALEDRRLLAFAAPVHYAVGSSPQGVVTGDLNNDGRLDLVTANAGNNTVTALLGNADGTFQPATTSPTGTPADIWPQSLAVGDFNGDGKLDLATGNNDYYLTLGGHHVSILMGNGDGTFDSAAPLIVSPGMGSWFVATGDLNADNKVDLVVTDNAGKKSFGISKVRVHLGRGDGTFAAVPPPWQPGDSSQTNYAAVLADFNRDGRMDVGVPTGWASTGLVKVYLGNGDGTLQQARDAVTYWHYPWTETVAATVGDFNGDERLDLVALSYGGSNLGGASLLLGNGDGTFQPWQPLRRGVPRATSTATARSTWLIPLALSSAAHSSAEATARLPRRPPTDLFTTPSFWPTLMPTLISTPQRSSTPTRSPCCSTTASGRPRGRPSPSVTRSSRKEIPVRSTPPSR